MKKWVSSTFDDFDDFGVEITGITLPPASSRGQKRIRSSEKSNYTKCRIPSDELLVNRYTPDSLESLAVHKKKVSEVEEWIESSLKSSYDKSCPILLLTGPTGAGKTATVLAVAKTQRIDVHEWINPLTIEGSSGGSTWKGPMDESFSSDSQMNIFRSFLLRSNKYPSLNMGGEEFSEKKIILIEDFPNIFFRETKSLHDILRHYRKTGRSPLVFIVSDSAGKESNERLLFPKDFQAETGIFNISFNPVAPTMLIKVLQKIVSQESNLGASSPSKEILESLANSCNGDIRCAINALQFTCLTDSSDLDSKIPKSSTKTKEKRQRGGKNQSKKKEPNKSKPGQIAIGNKDTTVYLFRALGKILYCKRGDPNDVPSSTLFPKESPHYRPPLLENPEDVVEKFQLNGEFFVTYLHQNYLEFFCDINDVVQASDYLSTSDYLLKDWSSRPVISDYASCVGTRSIMFCNKARASGTSTGVGWKPLHKPQWYSSLKQARENKLAAKCLFKEQYQWNPTDLVTQILPYMAKANCVLRNSAQAKFLGEITRFTSSKFGMRSHAEKLDEKDVNDIDDSGDDDQQFTVSSQMSEKDQIDLEPYDDDNVVIDDFDD